MLTRRSPRWHDYRHELTKEDAFKKNTGEKYFQFYGLTIDGHLSTKYFTFVLSSALCFGSCYLKKEKFNFFSKVIFDEVHSLYVLNMQMEIKIEIEFELFDALCSPDM